MAAGSSYIKNAILGQIKAVDGSATELSPLPFTMGDIKIGPLKAVLNDDVQIEARGKHLTTVHGKPFYPTISFSAFAGNLVGSSASTPGTLLEFLTKKGAYSANTSTLGSGSKQVYTVDLVITIEGTDVGDSADETVTCEDVVCTVEWNESEDGNRFTVSGKILGSVIVANSTNTVTYARVA